jgi:predicted glutamine amidotransferase
VSKQAPAACACQAAGMCRLLGLHAGADPVTASFWLLDAPDSLREQSHRNPDGAGIGVFDASGVPVLDKQPIAGYEDHEFTREARIARSRTFVAHVRYASVGAHSVANTHPFAMDGRIFAHNGTLTRIEALDRRLDELDAGPVLGDTDSERMFALITAETRLHHGSVADGIAAAIGWIADHLGVFSVNLIVGTPDELWALRYPANHELYVLDRTGAAPPSRPLTVASPRIRAHVPDLSAQPAVAVATEPMDGETGWRPMDSGELIRVGRDLTITSSRPFPHAPKHLLTLADLSPTAAASQAPSAQRTAGAG